jgi:hypothetical protein
MNTKRLLKRWALTAGFLGAALILPACKAKPTLQVSTPFTTRLGSYKSAEIKVVAEDEKSAPYATRLATSLMVKFKERDTFEKYRLSTDEGTSELSIRVTIMDLKKASKVSWGWYTRNSSRVEGEVMVVDVAKNETLSVFQVVARPRYSSIEEAIDDAATQIADYIRQNK